MIPLLFFIIICLILSYIINIVYVFMICSQARLIQLLDKQHRSHKQQTQIVTLIRNGGYGLPDCLFENSYLSHAHNPNSDQKYIQTESLIYSGLELNMPVGYLRKFLQKLRNQIGDNQYIARLRKFINMISSKSNVQESGLIDLIDYDKTDLQTRKKAIAQAKRKRKMPEFIELLNRYVQNEPMDQEGWLQLGEIYCEKSNYMKAAFCYQELVVLNPDNDTFTLRLAQIYLTEASKSNVDRAIKYLSYLVSKRPDNLRALWVLYRACCSSKKQEYSALKQVVYESINKIYSRKNAKIKIHEAL